jgi:hypothetical protein
MQQIFYLYKTANYPLLQRNPSAPKNKITHQPYLLVLIFMVH